MALREGMTQLWLGVGLGSFFSILIIAQSYSNKDKKKEEK